jgi:hypothetical protein
MCCIENHINKKKESVLLFESTDRTILESREALGSQLFVSTRFDDSLLLQY